MAALAICHALLGAANLLDTFGQIAPPVKGIPG
jgi:hypothetical protein